MKKWKVNTSAPGVGYEYSILTLDVIKGVSIEIHANPKTAFWDLLHYDGEICSTIKTGQAKSIKAAKRKALDALDNYIRKLDLAYHNLDWSSVLG